MTRRLCKVRAQSWGLESYKRFKQEGGLFRPVDSRCRERKLAGVASLKKMKWSSPETQQLCPIQGQKSQKTAPLPLLLLGSNKGNSEFPLWESGEVNVGGGISCCSGPHSLLHKP